jgi:acylphosphatase
MQEHPAFADGSSTIARQAIVSGVVQGVAFRHYTKLKARELALAGYVRNLANGDVEVRVQGARPAVEELLQWLEHGPPSARVERVEVREVEPLRASRFEVRRD